MGTKHLHKARGVKNDEFYTQLSEIELELAHYRHHFKGKHIYCNCDNPKFSKFWEYFHVHFSEFGLKQLTATYYDRTAFVNRYDYYGENDNDVTSAVVSPLNSHGDFRSPQCTAIMKEADIVITNPPYSLLRQFVVYLNKYATYFVFIGPLNTIDYKAVFPLIKSKKLFCGVNKLKTDSMDFVTSNNECATVMSWWFTNLIPNVEKPLYHFTAEYDESKYPKYDNYDAIEVSKVPDIPDNYYGIMGVPLTFFKHMNYSQFELIDKTHQGGADMSLRTKIYTAADHWDYSHLNSSAVLLIDGQYKLLYPRLLIKRKR
jgi:hypothetical protein